MNHFQRILLLGTGPASVQLAVTFKKHLKCQLGIAGRKSVRSADFFRSLEQNEDLIHASIQNEQHRVMAGTCRIDQVFQGYETIEGNWDTLIFAVTTDAYIEVLQQINDKLLQNVNCMVLISPTFGSGSLVRHYMRSVNPAVEVISFSTYYGDTRWMHGRVSNHVITTGVKNKICLGSTHPSSGHLNRLNEVMKHSGIALNVLESPFEAETRNISLYVHPPLFMNDYALSAIFEETDIPRYVYKLYPEGPITQEVIRDMLAQWKEIMDITDKLSIQRLNLLQFMTDDNYPVRPESLSRQDIESFGQLERIHQEYLLYIRYTSLLIDPFSQPDQEGKYFDFSAVPIRAMFINNEGCLDIPRMPKEDYYRIKMIQGIAKYLEVDCPTLDKFAQTYENKIKAVARLNEGKLLSDAFTVQSFEEHLSRVCSEIERIRV
ncbi:opine metallophore biosynthesis dehydrogenase [Paenibacillus albidus]|uniref:opine metallophore biosynthesis dehydrogenase n=1 Tax=Paenibacillus albidus TaxID=2041023 RepID=UPI001BE66A13|nr:opine metallophore biosynthesis dehydrogenase [Paenibacillus albidus]MBT2292744.1 opine metallophore biosynthesis dehydrogenase [Paenibacillus albidus]